MLFQYCSSAHTVDLNKNEKDQNDFLAFLSTYRFALAAKMIRIEMVFQYAFSTHTADLNKSDNNNNAILVCFFGQLKSLRNWNYSKMKKCIGNCSKIKGCMKYCFKTKECIRNCSKINECMRNQCIMKECIRIYFKIKGMYWIFSK